MLHGKVLIAQGGGPTAVINQSLVGAVQEARRWKADGVYGAMHGVSGIINEKFVDLAQESDVNLEQVATSPCSALGSTRDKPDLAYCQEIFRVLKTHDIKTFFYIGGNDSSDTLRILVDEGQKVNYGLRCIHIPKTIDNDLMISDHTPGFPSAALFVARAFAGINMDNRALPGVYVGVVMGRHAGFLTAASALARQFDDDGPHLIYLPERNFDLDNFVNDVKSAYHKYGRCIIAVSEGIHNQRGVPISNTISNDVERDAHGNVQLSGTGALADLLTDAIKSSTGIKRVRGDTFGYLQRSFLGCVSKIDQLEAGEVGIKAVQFAANAGRDGAITIHRVGDYAVDYRLTELRDVAGKTKLMGDSFIAESGADVTPAFIQYCRPLVGDELPAVARLQAPAVQIEEPLCL